MEERHEARFLYYLGLVRGGTAFKRAESIRWKCIKCGYVHEGTDAPMVCPACQHPQGYFEEYNVPY